jgi:hypothetical protein
MRSPAVLLLACVLAGCPEAFPALETAANATQQNPPTPPTVAVAQVRLEHAPTNQMLAGYYCTQVAPAVVCGLIGPVPQQQDLQFVFAVDLDVTNTNAYDIPVVELLAAFTAFPDAQGQANLGAACLTFCDDPSNCPQNGPNACRSDQHDIRTLSDFAAATVGFLVAVAEGQESLSNLRVRTIPANGTTRATVRLRLDPNTVLSLLRTMSQDAITTIQSGRQPQFSIPYQFEGTVWINVEHFGRFAARIPPYRGTWNLQ